MPLKIIKADITTISADAIVNAANNTLLGGGGVDGAIHHAAGPKLLEECQKLGGCEIGQAKITKGYKLKAKYVIHTVGPVWKGGGNNESELLRSCYTESLKLALGKKIKSIAFPLISAGVYGYPKDKALRIAIECCSEFMQEHEMDISIVIYSKEDIEADIQLCDSISSFLNENYVDLSASPDKIRTIEALTVLKEYEKRKKHKFTGDTVEEALKSVDESFQHMLFRKIDEKGIKDSECYKKAYVDRRLFYKIKNKKNYHPKKITVIAFAFALELSLDETKEMLMKAGYALTHSSKFDIIIEYCIEKKIYDLIEVNEILLKFDQAVINVIE